MRLIQVLGPGCTSKSLHMHPSSCRQRCGKGIIMEPSVTRRGFVQAVSAGLGDGAVIEFLA